MKNTRSPLRHDEKIVISRLLQIRVLEEIARLGRPRRGDLAFHGGTSIATTHASPRWSEDLDFMASGDFMAKLGRMRARVEKALQRRIRMDYPGCHLELVDRTGTDEGAPEDGCVDRWLVRWEHPDKIGAVRVKAEFFIAPAALIEPYQTRISYPAALDVRAVAALPAAEVQSIWADKIVAIANRPAVKFRDFYDLGFISGAMKPLNLDAEALEKLLETSMALYACTPQGIASGLNRKIVTDGLSDTGAFMTDMARWFSGSDHDTILSDRHLETMRDRCIEEIERARTVLGRMCACDTIQEMTP